MAESLALVWDLIARDGASPTFARVGASAEGAALGVGKVLAGFTALAAAGVVAASVKAAADFQAKMLLIQTQAGATRAEVEKMSPAILSLAGQVAQAPEALATSLYHVESTGLRGAQALDAVRVAAEGAKVGHADLEQTTNALTATIASGMLPATESYSQAMGQLNTIVGSGDMKMQDLNDALGTGLLVQVKQYGVTMNDVGAALADFGDNNIRGADAATKVRMAVQAIESPGKGAAAALGQIGLTTKQIAQDEQTGGLNKALTDLHDHLVSSGIDSSKWGQLMTDAFTKKAGGGIVTLIGTFDRFQQKYQEVSKGANSFGDAWAATTKTASFRFGQLKDTVDAVGIKIGTALLPPLGDLASWFSTVGIPAVEQFWASVQKFTQSQGFQSFLADVKKLGGEAWQAIQGFAGAAGGLWKTLVGSQYLGLGELLHFFTELPGPVQLATAAFVALRIAAAKGMFAGLLSGLGSVRGAFSNFGADVSATRGVLMAANVPMAGFAATLQTTAERGMGALKSAGTGVMNMLGGPWMASLALAGGAAIGFSASLSAIDTAAQSVTDSLKTGGPMGQAYQQLEANQSRSIADAHSVSDAFGIAKAAFADSAAQLTGYSSAADKALKQGTQQYQDWYNGLSSVARAQADVTKATDEYNAAADKYGTNSSQATTAASLLRQAQDGLAGAQERENQAQKTHMQLLQDQAAADGDAITKRLLLAQASAGVDTSLAQLNIDTAKGKGFTGDLAGESNNLAIQMIGVAKQAGDTAAAQAKANGITDDGTIANQAQLDWLKKVADQLTGPGHDAIVSYMTDLGKANVQHGSLSDAIGKLGLNVIGTWDQNTKVIQGATAQEIQDLKNLGLNVLALPGMPGHPAQILVTANTDPAYASLDAFTKKAQALGFVGAIFNVTPGAAPSSSPGPATSKTDGGNPIGMPPLRRATGGPITGPGSGTSDSVLIAASNGEHMWTAKEVAAAGGHAGVESIRKAVLAAGGGRADGGAIYPVDWSSTYKAGWTNSLNKAQAAQARAVASSVGGSERWRADVDAVLRMLGISLSADNGVLAIIQAESGGNPNAINLTDSNARAGHPSQGLMQTIPGTFARWRNPSLANNILDPLANIYAGVNYALHTYGAQMLMGGGNHGAGGRYVGYKDGTNYVPNDQFALLHRGEAVVPASKNQGAPFVGGSGPVEITGTLRFDADGLVHIVDGRIVEFATVATNRGDY